MESRFDNVLIVGHAWGPNRQAETENLKQTVADNEDLMLSHEIGRLELDNHIKTLRAAMTEVQNRSPVL